LSSAHPTSIEERRRLVAESLQVGNPASRSKDLPEQADPRHDCQIEVRVDEIRLYEHNPRRANNAKFAEIKESIRATGIRNPLTVTRRPGEKHFIVEAGGNTRLLAAQQLWAETRDTRFEKLTVIFRPWRSEGHVLVAHLIENEQRGDMTFWDKANGVLALKAQLEEEKGRALSLRQLEEELKAVGFPVNTATLAHYAFATARLRILGDGIPVLSGLDVKTIQPRLNLMKRYAHMRAALDEAALYAGVFEPVFRRHADRYRETGTFSALELCQACEEAVAELFGEDLAQFRMLLDALAQSPQAISLESLARPAVPIVSSANSQDQLRASIHRFAELAVEQGIEARARPLLAYLSERTGV
jgi:ParB family protein of integrating conjugative element (PFGI_1 class)